MADSPGSATRGIKAQNDPANLELLAAASHFYGRAKFIAGLQFFITVPMAVTSYCLLIADPSLKVWTTFSALTIALVDTIILERLQARYRSFGATAQEHFDCAVLDIPWNEYLCRRRLEPADLSAAASRFGEQSRLRDWYPPIVAEIDQGRAALISQFSAVRWDGVQRRKYSACLAGFGLAALFCLLVTSIYKNYKVADFILALYAPLAPAIIWTARESLRQRDAAERLDSLRSAIDRTWSLVSSEGLRQLPIRRIQDALFDARGKNALVFDWVYRLQRSEQEQAMNRNAAAMVSALKV